MKYLVLDAERFESGIRYKYTSDFIPLNSLISDISFIKEIMEWQSEYEKLALQGYKNKSRLKELDLIGIGLAKKLKDMFPDKKFEYYSDFTNQTIVI